MRSAGSQNGSELRDPAVPELDVAPPVRSACARPAGAAAAELLDVHGDLGFASATL